MNVARHEHEGESLMGWQAALGPQGDGEHGLMETVGMGSSTAIVQRWKKPLYIIFIEIVAEYITNRLTTSERITIEPRRTSADRIVVDHRAHGTDTTSTDAWISAFLIQASPIQLTFAALQAFGSASRRTAYESGYA